jgi:RNA polymerase sigma-70 factor (ECF subfamily)
MDDDWLAARFEENRGRLRAMAYRMLGSSSEADDAVQETWLRVSHASANDIENPAAWLTTIGARICLDMLRSRKARREEPLSDRMAGPIAQLDPEQEAVLADSVGLALLVVLDTLAPAERLAFVLHDMFAVPFDEIAPIVGHTPTTARQLASRARRRVHGAVPAADPDLARHRKVVEAFLAASRNGDFDALLALLDPDVTARADAAAAPAGTVGKARGARAVARHALMFSGYSRFAQPALVNGAVGIVVAPDGRLTTVLTFLFRGEMIAEIEILADPARLRELELAVIEG